MLANVFELETCVRMHATALDSEAVAVLLDQAEAFSNLGQGFICEALDREGIPVGVLRLLLKL